MWGSNQGWLYVRTALVKRRAAEKIERTRSTLKTLSQLEPGVLASPARLTPTSSSTKPMKLLENAMKSWVSLLSSAGSSLASRMVSLVAMMLKTAPMAKPSMAIMKPKSSGVKVVLTMMTRQPTTTSPSRASTYWWACLHEMREESSYRRPTRKEPTMVATLKITGIWLDSCFSPLSSRQVGSHSRKVQSRALKQQPIIRQRATSRVEQARLMYSQNQEQLAASFCSLPSFLSKQPKVPRAASSISPPTTTIRCSQLSPPCTMNSGGIRKPRMLPKSPAADHSPIRQPSSLLVKCSFTRARKLGQMLSWKNPKRNRASIIIGSALLRVIRWVSEKRGKSRYPPTQRTVVRRKASREWVGGMRKGLSRKPSPRAKQMVESATAMKGLVSSYCFLKQGLEQEQAVRRTWSMRYPKKVKRQTRTRMSINYNPRSYRPKYNSQSTTYIH